MALKSCTHDTLELNPAATTTATADSAYARLVPTDRFVAVSVATSGATVVSDRTDDAGTEPRSRVHVLYKDVNIQEERLRHRILTVNRELKRLRGDEQ